MTIEDQAIEILSGDKLLHIDMIEAIRRGEARLLDIQAGGVLLYHASAATWMMSAPDPVSARILLDSIRGNTGQAYASQANSDLSESDEPPLFVAHQEHSIAMAQALLGLPKSMPCLQSAYFADVPLPVPDGPGEIRRLDLSSLAYVHRYYSHPVGLEYLQERLAAGVFHGVFVKGRLAGFAGVHAEGSLGMLEVLPEFRRQGVAMQLQAYMTNWHLSLGYTPFAQVKVGNMASLALQRKSGYAVSDRTVTWLMDASS